MPRSGIAALALCILLIGCGYHTAGKLNGLPPEIRTIAIPAFVNQTQTYRVEQVLTAAVVQEFNTSTRYRIISNADSNPDAVLHGTVVQTEFAPVTYDSVTGRASSALVTVVVRVSLVDSHNHVIWENPSYTFREQYQVSRELSSFFEEDQPAVDRLSRDFARTLVSNIVEAY
jgi:outer membrane lipopolysaccharide assembly protein LptE/RlpB